MGEKSSLSPLESCGIFHQMRRSNREGSSEMPWAIAFLISVSPAGTAQSLLAYAEILEDPLTGNLGKCISPTHLPKESGQWTKHPQAAPWILQVERDQCGAESSKCQSPAKWYFSPWHMSQWNYVSNHCSYNYWSIIYLPHPAVLNKWLLNDRINEWTKVILGGSWVVWVGPAHWQGPIECPKWQPLELINLQDRQECGSASLHTQSWLPQHLRGREECATAGHGCPSHCTGAVPWSSLEAGLQLRRGK